MSTSALTHITLHGEGSFTLPLARDAIADAAFAESPVRNIQVTLYCPSGDAADGAVRPVLVYLPLAVARELAAALLLAVSNAEVANGWAVTDQPKNP